MDKYIIFLPDEFVSIRKCSLRFSKYSKLLKGLKKNGIDYVCGEKEKCEKLRKMKDEKVRNFDTDSTLTFDFETEPEYNKLYIHLCGTLYFSDDNYSRYRMNLEKELLLLLSGYLGAKEINIIDNKTVNDEMNVSSSVNVECATTDVGVGNTNNKSQKLSIKETYSLKNQNLLFVDNMDEFKQCFFKKINSINPNYSEYFEICSKLVLFTSKRFNLRMLSYSYNLEQECKNEKSIQVKTLLYNYGIGLEYKSSLEVNTTQMYEVTFFEDDELLFYHIRNENIYLDKFARLRNNYEIDKKIMRRDIDEKWGGYANDIFDEVINYAKDKNKYDKLKEWFDSDVNNRRILLGDCHNIKDERDVKEWFKNKNID